MAESNTSFEDIFDALRTEENETETETNESENENEETVEDGKQETETTADADEAEGQEREDANDSDDAGVQGQEEVNEEEEQEVDELGALKAQNEQLLKLINGNFEGLKPAKKEEVPSEEDPLDITSVVGDLDMDEILSSPQAFVGLLNKVAQTVHQKTLQTAIGKTSSLVNGTLSVRDLVNGFYSENSDLANIKPTVSLVAKNVGMENPDWEMPKVLAEAAKRTRTMLGMKPPEASNKRIVGKKPALPGNPGGRRSTPKDNRSKLTKEVHSLFDIN